MKRLKKRAEVAKRPTALVLRFWLCQNRTTSGASHLVSSNLTLSVPSRVIFRGHWVQLSIDVRWLSLTNPDMYALPTFAKMIKPGGRRTGRQAKGKCHSITKTDELLVTLRVGARIRSDEGAKEMLCP